MSGSFEDRFRPVVEVVLLAAESPVALDDLVALFAAESEASVQELRDEVRRVLGQLTEECAGRGVELREVAGGFRYQVRDEYARWVARFLGERPARYSRALLETLALIAYRQPITRGGDRGRAGGRRQHLDHADPPRARVDPGTLPSGGAGAAGPLRHHRQVSRRLRAERRGRAASARSDPRRDACRSLPGRQGGRRRCERDERTRSPRSRNLGRRRPRSARRPGLGRRRLPGGGSGRK